MRYLSSDRFTIPAGTIVKRHFPNIKRTRDYTTEHDVTYGPGEYTINEDMRDPRYDEFVVDLRKFGGDSLIILPLDKVRKL